LTNGILLSLKYEKLHLFDNQISKCLFERFKSLGFYTLMLYLGLVHSYIMKKILIIEDDLLISSLVQFRLKKDGYQTHLVSDGNEGIKAIDNYFPDLIITDVMMPFRSGIEIIHHARKSQPDTPIIVLSSLGEEEEVVLEAFNLGVSDFIPKPFNPNELAIRVKRILK
jgi:DNA-binding response OmpR family regulator